MSDTFQPADAFSFDRTIAQVKQGVDAATSAQAEVTQKASQAGKDAAALAQANMEAFVQASQVLAAGGQDLFRQMAEAGQAAMAEALNNMRALGTVQTPKAAIELHATILRSAATRAVSEGARFAQSGIELAERAYAPLMARAAATAETAFQRV